MATRCSGSMPSATSPAASARDPLPRLRPGHRLPAVADRPAGRPRRAASRRPGRGTSGRPTPGARRCLRRHASPDQHHRRHVPSRCRPPNRPAFCLGLTLSAPEKCRERRGRPAHRSTGALRQSWSRSRTTSARRSTPSTDDGPVPVVHRSFPPATEGVRLPARSTRGDHRGDDPDRCRSRDGAQRAGTSQPAARTGMASTQPWSVRTYAPWTT